MTVLSDIQAQLDQTSGIIEGFRRSIADGALIDLSGLDQSVEEMCGAIGKLPADQRLSVKQALITILDALTTLVDSLEEQQLEASDSLKGVSSRQQAVSAYGRSSNAAIPVTPGKEEPEK
ncbi:MAG: hypothetical protein HOM58_12160 [Rhodospirillaceae bacterium]|jgi:hypothetical protein|nr:hypothetical protein [Rhodospirillaceae bacterium]MBT5458903.1 hypothetical protein [Rhodospirillaceae bacterium]